MSEDQADMVLIHAGDFSMGAGTAMDHSPVHSVSIQSFYMDKFEVTNLRYFEFCQATGHRNPEYWDRQTFYSGIIFPDYPVIGVSWHDALAYADWCGKRLPTEAEWEYAARGGLAGKHYPHGDSLSTSDGNYRLSNLGGPVEVGSYPANGFGLHDMLGNVVEWVSDFYDPAYYQSSELINPQGPSERDDRPGPVRFRVIRGGGWHSGAYCSRVYYRNALPGNWVDFAVGFRCVKDLE